MNERSVFFDCWDTLVYFKKEDELWNIRPLMDHCLNKEDIPWEEVFLYSERFLHQYYSSGLMYEISIACIHRILVDRYQILLDCPVEECGHEVLFHLSPSAVKNVDQFLNRLERDGVFYGVISNTIYDEEDTRKVLQKYLPGHDFSYVFASKDYGVKKPNEDFFHVALSKTKRNIKESIFIGDAFYQDAFGSNHAGFKKSIWLNHRLRNEETEFARHPEIDSFPHLTVSGYDEVITLYDQDLLW